MASGAPPALTGVVSSTQVGEAIAALVSSLRSGHPVRSPSLMRTPQRQHPTLVMYSRMKRNGGVRRQIRFDPRRTFKSTMRISINGSVTLNSLEELRQIPRVQPPVLRRQDLVRPSSASPSSHPANSPQQHQSPKSRRSSMPHPSLHPHSPAAKLKMSPRTGVGIMIENATETVNGIANGTVTETGSGNVSGSVTEIVIRYEVLPQSPPPLGRQDGTRSRRPRGNRGREWLRRR